MGGKSSIWAVLVAPVAEVACWAIAMISLTAWWWTPLLPDYKRPLTGRETGSWVCLGIVFGIGALGIRDDRLFAVTPRWQWLLFALGFIGAFYFHDN